MTRFAQLLKNPVVVELLSTSGVRYNWGATSRKSWPLEEDEYVDCSEYAQGALIYYGLLDPKHTDMNAMALANNSERVVDEPRLLDLAFYGKPVSHVMLVLSPEWVIGASGGGSTTHGDNPEACVKLQRMRYRKDLTVVGRLKKELAP